MDNPPDFIHLFFRQFWRILEVDSSVKTAIVHIFFVVVVFV